MRISICDDDQFILEELKKYLEEYYSQEDYDMPELVAFSDGNALLADEGKKDIVFLDIEMPGLDGIFVGNMLKKKYPDIFIFIITAYDEYLDAAMDAHVFRYLRKPVEKNRLFQSLKIAMRRYYCLVSDIMIDQGNTFKKISESEIIYIEAQDKTTILNTVSGKYSSKNTIHALMETLNAGSFFQTHKSYIVNLRYVLKFSHVLIAFNFGTDKAYLARRKYKQFKKAYYTYLSHNSQ